MKFTDYNHNKLELQIQKFWTGKKVLEKLKKRNNKGKKFNFLQGPPYTSGKVHLGTAWNTVLKDLILRYKRSQGFNVWDRNGYDVHGLPTAHKVMAKYKLDTKEDIEKFGIGKFIKECKKFSLEMANQMTKDFQRMAVTLDYSDSYMALKNEYMEGEWWLIKQAYDKKRVYLGEKVMTWCANCETALAKHECEYKNISENSIFVKFPIKGKNNEYILIWTTTPWTIPFNLAVMAGPEIDYVKIEIDGEKWILAKALAGIIANAVVGKPMKILEEFKGQKLEGLKYVHPFKKFISHYEELEKDYPNLHTIILSEEHVDTTSGSGLVHCAPGCGPEDQEAAKPYNIPAFNNLSPEGVFPEEMGIFKGLKAKVDDKKFIEALKKENVLVAITQVEHDYSHCWRCHNPIIFRLTKQWFFKIEDLKDKMIKDNQKINWIPQTNAFDAWTKNLKDNSITRQRYWGTPVPIWKCSKCDNIEVIGSLIELKEKAGKIPEDIHRPWIDEIKWSCCQCNHGELVRIPDILDVWIDAGTASWNCLYYPQHKEFLKDFFPADLILEATEQVRLWFSMLSICSQLTFEKNPYKNVYMHGMLRDIGGVKMSKSLGNIISPDEMIEKNGADVLRYYMCSTNAGQDIKFSWDEATLKSRQLQILWNVHKLLLNLAKENNVNPSKLKNCIMQIEENYVISKLHSTIKKVTDLFDKYHLDETILPLEELFLELSRTYIQIIRDKSVLGSNKEKETVIFTIYYVLLETLKMFSVVTPHICEAIYLNLRDQFGLKEESITHFIWPKTDFKKINNELEEEMEISKQIVQATLNAREKAKLGLRWPVAEIVIESKNDKVVKAMKRLAKIVKNQTNTKKIKVLEKLSGVKIKVKANPGKIGPVYGQLSPQIIVKLNNENPEKILEMLAKCNVYKFKINSKEVNITKEMINIERSIPENYVTTESRLGSVYLNISRTTDLESEGFAREIMRQVQNLRKNSGLEKLDQINMSLEVPKDMLKNLVKFKKDISEKVGAVNVNIVDTGNTIKKKYKNSAEFKLKNKLFKVWFEKVV